MQEVTQYLTQTAWFCSPPTQRHTDQWNRTEVPEINSHNYSHLLYDKRAKTTLEKRQPLQVMGLGKLDIHIQKTETRSLSLTLYINEFKIYQKS
jgi:hypothetical protein